MAKSNADSLKNLEENLQLQGVELKTFPFALQFNKRDLHDLLSIEELDAALNEEFKVPFFEAVATKGIGVQETLEGIVKLVMRSLRQRYDSGKGARRLGAAGPAAAPSGPRPPGLGAPQAPAAPSPAAPASTPPPAAAMDKPAAAAGSPAVIDSEPTTDQFKVPSAAAESVEGITTDEPTGIRDAGFSGDTPIPEVVEDRDPTAVFDEEDLSEETTAASANQVTFDDELPIDEPDLILDEVEDDLSLDDSVEVIELDAEEPAAAADKNEESFFDANAETVDDGFEYEEYDESDEESEGISFTDDAAEVTDDDIEIEFDSEMGISGTDTAALFEIEPGQARKMLGAAAASATGEAQPKAVEDSAVLFTDEGMDQSSEDELVLGPEPTAAAAPDLEIDEIALDEEPELVMDEEPGLVIDDEPEIVIEDEQEESFIELDGDDEVLELEIEEETPAPPVAPKPPVPEPVVAPAAPAPKPAGRGAEPFMLDDQDPFGDPFASPAQSPQPGTPPTQVLPPETPASIRPLVTQGSISPLDNQLQLRLEGTGAIAESGQVRALDVTVPVPGSWVGNRRVTLQLRLTLEPSEDSKSGSGGAS